jgi:hypothetical protein
MHRAGLSLACLHALLGGLPSVFICFFFWSIEMLYLYLSESENGAICVTVSTVSPEDDSPVTCDEFDVAIPAHYKSAPQHQLQYVYNLLSKSGCKCAIVY